MEVGVISKIALRVGLALVVVAVGAGIYKLTHRASPHAVPEPLLREFRELSAVETGRGLSDSRELTQQQLDAMLYAGVGNATPAMVAWLLQRGANPRVNQKVYGASYADRSALQLAAGHGRCEQEKMLIAKVGELTIASANGAKDRTAAAAAEVALFANERDSDRRTPLHYAVLGGERACVAALLDVGARVDARDSAGVTPLGLAQQKFTYLVPILEAARIEQGSVDAGALVATASPHVPKAAQPEPSLPGAGDGETMLWILIFTALTAAALFVVSQAVKHPRVAFIPPAPQSALPPCAIRPLAGAADVAACEAIYRLNEPGRFPEGARSNFLEYIRQRQKALFLVAEVEGTIVGFGGITMDRKGKLEFAHLVYGMVDPSHQGKGIGTALLLARLAVLPVPRRWWTVLFVPVAGSESFYARFGFRYDRATATATGGTGDLYRTALTPKGQAQCIAVLGDRLRIEPLGKTYIPSMNTIRP
jgi:GNAT superfamily N-acetyltransferase